MFTNEEVKKMQTVIAYLIVSVGVALAMLILYFIVKIAAYEDCINIGKCIVGGN